MGWFDRDKLQIIGFQSYGTPSMLHLRGRALEDESIDLDQKGFFNLLRNTWKRFETDEVRNTGIVVELPNGELYSTTTDNHGYFLLKEQVSGLSEWVNKEGWLQLGLSFADTGLKRRILHQNKFPAKMLIPKSSAEYGVISDIDDTILHTGVVSSLKWRVLANTFFKSATSRSALEGTSDFYHKLHRGKSGNAANPIFYVSHSPWNLYRYLELFLRVNNFPKGPILLRSMASFRSRNKQQTNPHKYQEIVHILDTYPKLSFILIGDSGERDGDIYLDISRKHPGRIKAIYLRSVNDAKRVGRIKEMFENNREVPFLLVEKTAQALAHAKALGFIQ